MKQALSLLALYGLMISFCVADTPASTPKWVNHGCCCCKATSQSAQKSYYIFSWNPGEKLTLPPGIPEA